MATSVTRIRREEMGKGTKWLQLLLLAALGAALLAPAAARADPVITGMSICRRTAASSS